jgi:putative addiction module component (TIGR02574 family)
MTKILEQIALLSVEEKIILVERVWDDIALNAHSEKLEMSHELEAELARRLALIKAGKTQLFSWNEVKQNIFSHYHQPTHS